MVEKVLYEFSFSFSNLLGLSTILIVGLAFFFAVELIGGQPNPPMDLDIRVKEISPKLAKFVLRSIGVLSILLYVLLLVGYIKDYNEYKERLATDRVSVVEGYVENLHLLSAFENGAERFEINGVCFYYSDDATNGYQTTSRRGGVITHNGQHLRIKYVTDQQGENVILYICEIRQATSFIAHHEGRTRPCSAFFLPCSLPYTRPLAL